MSSSPGLFSTAEAACAAKAERLFAPADEAEMLHLQRTMENEFPSRLPAIVGFVRCRYSFRNMWQTSLRELPRTA